MLIRIKDFARHVLNTWIRPAVPCLKYGLLFFAVFLVVLFAPLLIIILLAANAFCIAVLSTLQFYAASLPHKRITPVKRNDQPFVSIHIPTYNEPPELVCETLQALSQLDYHNYEVIVLDNNTKDVHVWIPVQEHCKKLGNKFRFYHIDNVKGYKAGALNLCYELSSPETEYILVIDADYKVRPELLSISLSYFSDNRVALVQFPQSYYNAHKNNRSLSDEYEHFFQIYMNMANCLNCVLSTGTVSVIRKEALARVGLWSDRTITEDVDLGLRLHEAGYEGIYVPSTLGKGLMPADMKSLRRQRERWAYGNTQTFFNFLRMSRKFISLPQFIGISTQLTAWVNFLLIPIIVLLLTAAGSFISPDPAHSTIAIFAVSTIWLHLFSKVSFFMLAFRKRGKSIRRALLACAVHLGLVWEGSGSWFRYLMRDEIGFKRTNKFRSAGLFRDLLPGMMLSLALVVSSLLLFFGNDPIIALVTIAAATVFLSVLYTHRQVKNTYEFFYGKSI